MLHHCARRIAPSSAAQRLALLVVVLAAACGGEGTPTSPSFTSPSPTTPIVAGGRSGPVHIAFVDATPAPGATIAGCGSEMSGCVNRLRMRFLLTPPASGPVLHVVAFLHAQNTRACLVAETGPMQLTAGQKRPIEIVFDRADQCGVPNAIATMAVVVEGTVEVASRQEWLVSYRFDR